MPVKVQNDLPARAILESENIFVMDEARALSQEIRPLQILILNLMPIKEDTEMQLLRALSNTPLQVDCTFLKLATHESKNTSASHLNKFYITFDEIRKKKYDGMIITGAPVENYEYEEVNYWPELTKIMEWTKTHVHSTLHICWGAQAGLYYHYGIPKYRREKKLSGIYRHEVLHHKVPLVRGMDDYIMAPHSRYTEVRREDIEKHPELNILVESKEAGVFLIVKDDGSQIFVQGHPEYDRMTLNAEYHRDLQKGINPEIPCNYYEDDDPYNRPMLTWRNACNTLYSNWLNYYVYQTTDYILDEMDDFTYII
jgi:homoserine O-succinyltransferase